MSKPKYLLVSGAMGNGESLDEIADTMREIIKSSDLEWIKNNIYSMECETAKTVNKENASKLTISKLDEEIGCFVPIMITDITKHNSEFYKIEIE